MKNSILTYALLTLAICTFFSCAKEDLNDFETMEELAINSATEDLPLFATNVGTVYEVLMTGDEVVPSAATTAIGETQLAREQDGIAYSYKADGLQNVLEVSLHIGPMGSNGPLVARLEMKILSNGSAVHGEGQLTAQDLIGPLAGNMDRFDRYLSDNQVYISVQSLGFPEGEIRAQFMN